MTEALENRKHIKQTEQFHQCFCVGPQDGEPLCPCQMRDQGIQRIAGRWVKPATPPQDLGPAYSPSRY